MSRRVQGYKHKLKVFWPASPKDPATIVAAAANMQKVANLARELGATVIADNQDWGSTTEIDPPRLGGLQLRLPAPDAPAEAPAEAGAGE